MTRRTFAFFEIFFFTSLWAASPSEFLRFFSEALFSA